MPDRTCGMAFGCMDAAKMKPLLEYYPARLKFPVKNCLLLVPASMYLMDDE